ncbi:amphi-Trp domain-containing protein [Salinadaptatus halalkaliphilus]|uniref:Amphi-Trp domain-containing protein n=1 Tax=Salinadaptatus halalkaliphilus TaxID=2419781 RepID=A0A4S3TK83_9EURY|nr:amphi-Trp domain-containing protein [Salinadaptatus halalkaliphilus]THE64491.1 amphi-Trp domain-containing protein [Salinadaptatus halalkaliphilus]
MPEKVLFKFEREMNTDDIAAYLRTVADTLEAGDSITLEAGDESVTMEPPARPTFEIKAEHETPSSGGPGEFSIEFELEWDENGNESGSGSGDLRID